MAEVTVHDHRAVRMSVGVLILVAGLAYAAIPPLRTGSPSTHADDG